jgi:DnaJ-domain-containing protein 1
MSMPCFSAPDCTTSLATRSAASSIYAGFRLSHHRCVLAVVSCKSEAQIWVLIRCTAHRHAQRAGSWSALQAAARAALQQQRRSTSVPPAGERLPRPYLVLGLQRSATVRDVTRAYRMMAARWHPDKWRRASVDEQQVAERRFRIVAGAYEALMDPSVRARLDAA